MIICGTKLLQRFPVGQANVHVELQMTMTVITRVMKRAQQTQAVRHIQPDIKNVLQRVARLIFTPPLAPVVLRPHIDVPQGIMVHPQTGRADAHAVRMWGQMHLTK